MKIKPSGSFSPVVTSPEKQGTDAKPAAPAEVPLSTKGLEQLEKFVKTIHGAVDNQVAGLEKKGKEVPPALLEKKKAADDILAAAKSGRSMSASEVATQLNALLWELNPAQLTQLHEGLTATAKDFGELAKLQGRFIPGLPATMESVVDLLTDAAKIPTTVHEADRMLKDIETSFVKYPEQAERLSAQRDLVAALKGRIESGETILKPLSLPTTQAGAREAVTKLTEQLGEVHAKLAALIGDKEPAQLTGDAKAQFDELSAEAVKLGTDLQTLEAYAAQLGGYLEPTAMDRTGLLMGVSIGPAIDLAKWVPGFPVPIFGGVGAGIHLFEKERATNDRKLDWYGAANLQTPFGGAGYALSPSKKGFSAAFNPPLGTQVGISLATHPFHGRKLDLFIPGLFRAEATSTGALAMTLFAPVPIPGIKVGLTVLVRNPVLANVTGPLLWAMDKVAVGVTKVWEYGKQTAKDVWAATFKPGEGTSPPVAPSPA